MKNAMIQPVDVQSRGKYRIWLQYSDGSNGEIDLSDVAGSGVFKAWDEPGYFDRVYIASHRAIAWGDEIELCPDALYLELTGKPVEEIMPGAKPLMQDA